jgi:hypothetical protein
MRRGPRGWLAINGSGHAGGAISRIGCGTVIFHPFLSIAANRAGKDCDEIQHSPQRTPALKKPLQKRCH